MKQLKDKLQGIASTISEAIEMCSGLYPEGTDPDDDMNGSPKMPEGKPMESDAKGNSFGDKEMKKKAIAKMLAKKMKY